MQAGGPPRSIPGAEPYRPFVPLAVPGAARTYDCPKTPATTQGFRSLQIPEAASASILRLAEPHPVIRGIERDRVILQKAEAEVGVGEEVDEIDARVGEGDRA